MNAQPIGPRAVDGTWLPRLASLIAAVRPDWNEPGIRSALLKVADRPLIDVTAAAVAACRRVDQTTPAVIALDGPHWPTAQQAQRTYAEPGIVTWCEHGRPGALHCPDCQPKVDKPDASAIGEIRRAAREAS